jgi:hypothetical protein
MKDRCPFPLFVWSSGVGDRREVLEGGRELSPGFVLSSQDWPIRKGKSARKGYNLTDDDDYGIAVRVGCRIDDQREISVKFG